MHVKCITFKRPKSITLQNKLLKLIVTKFSMLDVVWLQGLKSIQKGIIKGRTLFHFNVT